MTDRYFAFTVVLDHDIRDDDAQPIISAIQHIKGVLTVEPHTANFESQMAEERAKRDLRKKLWEVLQ